MTYGILNIKSNGGVPVIDIANLLLEINELYVKYCSIEEMIERDILSNKSERERGITIVDTIKYESQYRDELILKSVELHSPGFLEFLGQLNPLNFILELINGIHNRKKDIQYRNTAEEEKLKLENLLLQNKVIAERMQIMKQAGVDKETRQKIVIESLMPNIQKINNLNNCNVIGEATVIVTNKSDNNTNYPRP